MALEGSQTVWTDGVKLESLTMVPGYVSVYSVEEDCQQKKEDIK